MWLELSLLAGGAFLGALVVGSAGFAFAMVVTGIWIYALPPVEIVLLASICATLLYTMSVWRFRREIDYGRLWPFLVGGLLGAPLGVLALQSLNPGSFRDLFGIFVLTYIAYALMRPQLPVLTPAAARLADAAVGWLSGILGGLAMLHGTLPTIWCDLRGWSKHRARSIYQPYILFIGAFVMLLLSLNVDVDWSRVAIKLSADVNLPHVAISLNTDVNVSRLATALAVCLPALAAGLWLGQRIFDWLGETHFQRLVLALILASGVSLLL